MSLSMHKTKSVKRTVALFLTAAGMVISFPAPAAVQDTATGIGTAHIVLICLAIVLLLFIGGVVSALSGVLRNKGLWKEISDKGSQNKMLVLIPVLLFLPSSSGAADMGGQTSLFSDTSFLLLLALDAVLLFVLYALTRLLRNTLNTMAGVAVAEPDFIDRLSSNLTKSVPLAREEEILMDHSYDGIRELDNVLPPWWVYLFWGSIVWGFGYLFYFHISAKGDLSAAEYEKEMAAAKIAVEKYRATLSNLVDENTVELLTDEKSIEAGKAIFDKNCFTCHGMVGEGNSIGPNLTDAYWLHGGGIRNVFTTIKYGVPAKGMISWEKQLPAGDIQHVASYILSLQGSNPPNGKAPQGEMWKEEGPLGGVPAEAMVADTASGTEQKQ